MKQLAKTLAMVVMLAQLLSSCYSSKNLNKGDESFTDDFLSKIEPGKRYEFKLKTGQTQTIYVTSVEGQTIAGFLEEHAKGKMTKTNYSASFKSVEENVTEIYVRKFNPYLTTAACVVPTTLLIIVMVNAINNMTFTAGL